MPEAQYYSKVTLNDGNGTVVMDLTQDTVTKNNLLRGETAHGADGAPITGECDYTVDASTCDALTGEVLNNKKFAVGNQVKTGNMPNRGAVSGTISDISVPYTVPDGYHDGTGTVGIDATELQKFIGSNIKSGITLMGVPGTYSGEPVQVETNKSATPSWSQQIILPDSGYDYLAQVTVAAIPTTTTQNSGGGLTLTIG